MPKQDVFLLKCLSMFNEIDLKDLKYLKEYESQIRMLPLDELYEVLDIIKKDKSPERIDIVNKRIQEIESPNEEPICEEDSSDKVACPTDEKLTRHENLTAEELDEVEKTVEEIRERHKDDVIVGYDHHAVPIYETRQNIESGKHIENLRKRHEEMFNDLAVFSILIFVVGLIYGLIF